MVTVVRKGTGPRLKLLKEMKLAKRNAKYLQVKKLAKGNGNHDGDDFRGVSYAEDNAFVSFCQNYLGFYRDMNYWVRQMEDIDEQLRALDNDPRYLYTHQYLYLLYPTLPYPTLRRWAHNGRHVAPPRCQGEPYRRASTSSSR